MGFCLFILFSAVRKAKTTCEVRNEICSKRVSVHVLFQGHMNPLHELQLFVAGNVKAVPGLSYLGVVAWRRV